MLYLFHLDDGGGDKTTVDRYSHGDIDVFVVFDASFYVRCVDDGMLGWIDSVG